MNDSMDKSSFSRHSYKEIAELGDLIRKTYSENGLTISPNSDLGESIAICDELPSLFEKYRQGKLSKPADINDLGKAVTILRIGTLLKVSPVAPARHVLRMIASGPVDHLQRTTGQTAEAKNYELEAVTLGILGAANIPAESVEPPDIVIEFPTGQRGAIACKRPQSIPRIDDCLHDAKHQIARANVDWGAVAIGVDGILDTHPFLQADDEATLRRKFTQRAGPIINQARRYVENRLRGTNILGVIYIYSTVAILGGIQDPNPTLTQATEVMVNALNEKDPPAVLQELVRKLKLGLIGLAEL